MIDDYLEIRNAEGMPKLVDSSICTALMLNTKNAVRNYAIALTESATPTIRNVLRTHLDKSINMYDEIASLMISKGWLHTDNMRKQLQIDSETAKTALQISSLDLFPGNTSRLGTFATPEK